MSVSVSKRSSSFYFNFEYFFAPGAALFSNIPFPQMTAPTETFAQSLTQISITKTETSSNNCSGIFPWHSRDGASGSVFMIGISGGSASGKTSVANRVIQGISLPNVVLISMDSFYNVLTPEQRIQAQQGNYNFDTPSSFDLECLEQTLYALKQGQPVEIPDYDFCTHSRTANSTPISGSTVVVFEGIMALYPKSILPLLDLKVFVDTDDDIRLARRLIRDITVRGRCQSNVLEMYMRFAKSGYENYILPSARNADIIIPRGGDNEVAINLLIKHIKALLMQRGINFRRSLIKMCKERMKLSGKILVPENAHILPASNCIRNLLTIIRSSSTEQATLIEVSQRLATLVLEHAMELAAFNPLVKDRIVAVSILRAGNIFKMPLKTVLYEVEQGELLIQNDQQSGNPLLHFCSLPNGIDQSLVLLMDASIASGATAMMAVKVLLENGVPESRIIFVSLVCAVEGLLALNHAFPAVRVVCAEVDNALDESFFIAPGFGNLGQRYFGI